jgi:RHS repeat-associated protein
MAKDSHGRLDSNSITANLQGTNSYAYDLNGNLLTNGTRILEYDDENQLIRITQPTVWKSEFTYDGKMLRRIRKEYTWNGSWLQTNEVHYVYDGNLVIQERDGNNLPQVTYTRGTDLSGSFQTAGGIGGLLARTVNSSTLNPQLSIFAHAFYHADGNGNVTCLIYTNQAIAAKYEYDPYGYILSQSGSLAEANLYRFSSKEYSLSSGLVYYLYRYYQSDLQRWLNRDPIEERGGKNLYGFIRNDPIGHVDPLGLKFCFWLPWETTIDREYHEPGVAYRFPGQFFCVWYAVLETTRRVYCCGGGHLTASYETVKKKGVMKKDGGHFFSDGDPDSICKDWWEQNKPVN